MMTVEFQSTHPVRGGTLSDKMEAEQAEISIHPPREGWDSGRADGLTSYPEFQSTHPVRGGTAKHIRYDGGNDLHFNPPTP